ncbi:MAG: histidine kinase [Acidobacteriota bacterium]
MHPILAQRWRLGLYLLLFVQAGVLAVEVQRGAMGGVRRDLWLLVLPIFIFHAFSCLASWYLCRTLPLDKTRPSRLLASQLGTAILTSAAAAGLGVAWSRVLEAEEVLVRGLPLVFAFALFLYSLSAALHYLFLAQAASREAEARAYELRLLAREAELQALRAQLDPHFLFNSLHSINALVGRRPKEARTMCVRLADFLRRTVQVGEKKRISLDEELRLIEDYLAVEQIRFGDRLAVKVDVSGPAKAVGVPPLILQPLVENAVRHGIAHRLDGGTVEIFARREDGELRLRVVNPCDPDRPRGRSPSGTGVGLANVRRRLEAAWGPRSAVEVESGDERFGVELRFPAATVSGTTAGEGGGEEQHV